jgi:hypothetical protein
MDKRNKSGCLDLTAFEALKAVAKSEKKYLPLVYVASPYSGNVEFNRLRARGYCRFAVSKGNIPLAPHLHYPQFMDDADAEQRALGLRFALILLGKCDELWVFGEKVTSGMSAEIAKAKRRGIPIKYFNSKCEEVTQDGLPR